MWKYDDDTTISEVISKHSNSVLLQSSVDKAVDWSAQNVLHLHPGKCKEMRIQFARNERMFDPITMNGRYIEIVKSAKVLGLTLTDNLKWIEHIRTVVVKASKRLYLLEQLRRADVKKNLIEFYNACIRSVFGICM